ncbi:ankyrin repeat domain-containing protein [Sediminibacterium sp.]|uniref:ankyrin repeat domain-containing protein n=1 Tax=Sediminibacterium sp. TaxID=1917865 RepID=UPI0025F7B80C|nr:ankyrin repeat domain-containing protein [Sediminibacterium sp.]MBT9483880.1 hypothetical protein [Sediminibacterium sp.]
MKSYLLKGLFFCCLSFTWTHFVIAQKQNIFSLVKEGDPAKLKNYLDTTKIALNITNTKGYSPLHMLIEHYVQYRVDYAATDEAKYNITTTKSEMYWDCMKLLLDKGAPTDQLTPDGWNALQFAVLNGKLSAINQILLKAKGGDIRDQNGNTLLHLSMLINPDEIMPTFHEQLSGLLTAYKIEKYTTNFLGQTPLVFYMSQPRCNWKNPLNVPAFQIPSTTNSQTNINCQTSATSRMLEVFQDYELKCILTKDFSGRNAMDYMKIQNPWAEKSFASFVSRASAAHKEIENYQRQINEITRQNLEIYKNNKLAAKGSNECTKCLVDKSFNIKYEYDCNKNQFSNDKIVAYKMTSQVSFEVKPHKMVIYFPNHVIEAPIISSKYNSIGFIQYELDNYAFKSVGFKNDLSHVFLIRKGGSVEGYCNF